MTTAISGSRLPSDRVYWVDNLRTATILLVVNMHACVTYSHVGSWYYMHEPEPPLSAKIPFAFWQGHLQSFFMGLLFFIAGYFADKSLAKREPKAFLAERWKRLGIPTLIYMLAIHPLIVFGMLIPAANRPALTSYYLEYIGKGKFLGSSGPMWFALALLLMSIPLAIWFKADTSKPTTEGLQLKAMAIVGLGISLGLASFLVRLVQPVGSSILNMQLCYFSQYVVAFGLGVVVNRRNALNAVASNPLARRAGWSALILGPIALATIAFFAQHDLAKNPPPINGGWNWEALAEALWEQCAGVGLGLGAMALCAKVFNSNGAVAKWLSDRSFGVYLLHPPILVALAIALSKVDASIGIMMIVLTLAGYGLSLVAADLARRIPFLKTVL